MIQSEYTTRILPVSIEKKKKSAIRVPQIILNAVIIFLLILMIFPLAMSVWNAFKLDYQFTDTMWYPTFPLNIYNLFDAFSQLKGYMFNTVMVGVIGGGGLLIIAGLAADGITEIEEIDHIDRGYEDVVEKLTKIGADIKRVTVTDGTQLLKQA